MKKTERRARILSIIADLTADEILSTRKLAQRLDVSEITIRRDLQELDNEGLIHRQHGGVMQARRVTQTSIGILLVYDYGKFSNPFFNELMEGIDQQLRHMGNHAIFVKTITETPTPEAIREVLTQYPVNGLIIIGNLRDELFQVWQALVPHIVVALHANHANVDAVLFDAVDGMRSLIQHLCELGHRRIGFVMQRSKNKYIDGRYTAYMQGINELGLDNDAELVVQVEDVSYPTMPVRLGHEGASQLMALHNPPTAIMCMSDLIALGAMQWLQENGYSIPGDVAVTGSDNIPDSQAAFPALTTVHVHKSYIGKLAVQQLYWRMENPTDPAVHIITPTRIVKRQSTTGKTGHVN